MKTGLYKRRDFSIKLRSKDLRDKQISVKEKSITKIELLGFLDKFRAIANRDYFVKCKQKAKT